MKDTIYGNNVIADIELLFENPEPNEHDRMWNNAIAVATQEVKKHIPSVQQWIPCGERLPEEHDYRACHENADGAVFWCTDKGIIGMGWYYESTHSWADLNDEFNDRLGNVIAWMPLPEPMKGEGE